ncbi:MAG: NADP-dependent isocitrate dehydrogenase [Proteobacteria bacterium]|nr:NADP-dependent isocitrate dehydrogenase [Pseudomonadota bacterium]
MTAHNITLIPGDGIGPEVTKAARKIIDATGIKINWEICEAGAEVFKKGKATGVPQETIDSINKNKIALKGPLETPVGFGEKSANVTLRKMFETYGNIRPVREFPGVKTPYSRRNIDLVIVRENVEDLYAGIEHMQTPNVAQCLKLISRKGCEKIVRLGFEFARSQGRKTIHCATKANIMKFSEGMLKRTFEEIAKEYPDLKAEHIIVDNCAHQLVKKPEQFEVIVTTNMNGDILSDLSSALIGGLGFAPGANIGDNACIFEAVHGSAPKYAGKNTINPMAVILSGVMMLRHLGEFKHALDIEHALFVTCAVDKVLTRDVVGDANAASTTLFTDTVIKNLGKRLDGVVDRPYKPLNIDNSNIPIASIKPKERFVEGVDVFIENIKPIVELGKAMEQAAAAASMKLKLVTCRGMKVYPLTTNSVPDLTDQVTARFAGNGPLDDSQIQKIITEVGKVANWSHIEKLHVFDGKPGYTRAHGEE